MIRLIGVDVDGTLLDSHGRMPDENRKAIDEVVARGVHVALVTGRSYPFARPVADPLPPSVTLIVSNGAIERAPDGTTLARRLLPRTTAESVLEATRPYRHSAALIFDRDEARQFVFETMDWEHPNRKGYWARNQSLIERCVPLEEALVEDPIQVMFNGGVEEMRVLAGRLRSDGTSPGQDVLGQDSQYAVSVTEYEDRDFTLLDVTARDATKGHALAWRAREMGLSRGEVMAVGDNFNDLEMLEFAGCPVVMGNAVGALKNKGWHVTASNDDGGLARAIRQFA